METLNKLIQAVENRKPIMFTYNKPGKIQGIRVGNVHAIFIFVAKSGLKSTKIHIVQTGGVSDSAWENPFPDFRMFDIKDVGNIEIIESEPKFEILTDKYNPEWTGYSNTIAKV
ncbi:hypothetical protein P9222_29780 [Paenibacillus amylolyticus]|uniref:hypothetical protein n=1 Tax=Paenibacillus sp. 1781tsa1 TaxID=2953810 RepID=UPI0020A098B0|nr:MULTISPECIES: hypothetical protein [Paenibacillus]MCP1182937.1 hypothetical protein [Paenibacillus sp. 1781tsa1]WFR62360.1 hypothetical protein P9222_29780 [Paenibacillus amylolyticus]